MAKLERLASQDHIGKKYDLVTQCVVSGKSTEEIERLANLFKQFVERFMKTFLFQRQVDR